MVHLSCIPYERDDFAKNFNTIVTQSLCLNTGIQSKLNMGIGNNSHIAYIPQLHSQSQTSKTLPMPIASNEESIEIEKIENYENGTEVYGVVPSADEIFFDNKYDGFNQWIEICEPVNIIILKFRKKPK